MRFIDILAKAFEEALKETSKKLNKLYNDIAPKNWCIGSGSNFIVYKNITIKKATKIFKNLNVRQYCGKLIEKKEVGYFTTETYYTMESINGQTTLFMFPINNIIKERKQCHSNKKS